MSIIIYGTEIAQDLREQMRQKILSFKEEGRRAPHLTVVFVGDNPASESYVKGKAKACASVGIDSETVHLPGTVSQQELEETLKKFSADDSTDGILLQLPLPKGLDENAAILCISPEKDVDGLHPVNFGRFFLNQPAFVPCTPLGCMEILKRMGCDPDGKRAVVVGRSKLVGTPVSRLLMNANATVTVCHSHTKNLPEVTRTADILIAAVGKPKLITAEYVREGAYVIDVGVNRVDGHLVGDVDFDAVKDIAAAITPVPKGVGPMTITMLLQNTITAYERKMGLNG